MVVLDGRSIYELCDYNVPYQISLQDAINKDMLVTIPLLWRFLVQSGNGFFVRREGAVLALNNELDTAIRQQGFAEQMEDITAM